MSYLKISFRLMEKEVGIQAIASTGFHGQITRFNIQIVILGTMYLQFGLLISELSGEFRFILILSILK